MDVMDEQERFRNGNLLPDFDFTPILMLQLGEKAVEAVQDVLSTETDE